MTFGTHGSTYGGNPLAMAAGTAVMEAVANDEFLEHVRDTGARLKAKLEQFIGNYPELFELVRGEGLMLRVLPPLVIGDAEIDEFFDKLSAGAADYTVPDAS